MRCLLITLISCSIIGILTGCSKTKAPDVNSCYLERDQLAASYQKSQGQIKTLLLNMESEVKKQTLTKQNELNLKIESYQILTEKITIENQQYRAKLRGVVLFSFVVIIISMIVINLVIIRKYSDKKTRKKIYEE